MISVGTINSDSTSFEANMNNYLEKINSIGNDIWEGKSIDSLKQKVQAVVSESKSITSLFSSFASAAKLANDYDNTKQKYDEYVNKKNSWSPPVDNPGASNPYSDDVREYKNKLEQIQKNIDSELSGIS